MSKTRTTGECSLNIRSVLLQCNTCFRILHLLYHDDIEVMWRKTIKQAFCMFYTLKNIRSCWPIRARARVLSSNSQLKKCSFPLLRLQYAFRGVSRTSDVARPKPLYQINAYRTGYQTITTILKRNELSKFSRLLNASTRNTFWTLHVRANFVFRLFNVSLSFRTQSPKQTVFVICDFQFQLTVTEHCRNRI